MVASNCLPQIDACAIRVTELDAAGVPNPGSGNLYVSDALTEASFTPVYEEGADIVRRNACGSLCLAYKAPDILKRITFGLTLCTPDPVLHSMLAGGAVLSYVDGAKTGVGYAAPQLLVDPTPNGVSIELWAKQVDENGALDPDFPYAWWVFPRVYLKVADRRFANEPHDSPFTGYAIQNENWFDGPLNDWPVDSDRVWQWVPTDTLPAAACSSQTVAVS